jgi:shikimate kinase
VRGVGRAGAAITFVNAVASGGTGSAGGIVLPVEAVVDLHPAPAGETGTCDLDPGCDTPLARSTLLAALRAFAAGRDWNVRLAVRSQIPVSCGLKSSSAVGWAIASAVANAVGAPGDPTHVARLAADVAQEIGLSATGAFDDALAAGSGDVVVTDNRARRVLRRDVWPSGWTVVLRIPRERHAPSPQWAPAFGDPGPSALSAVRAALKGEYAEAMRRNTEEVERVMGYDFAPLRARLRAAGAVASGVSGMGPALAAIVSLAHRSAVARVCCADGAAVLETELATRSGPPVARRGDRA